MEWVVLILLAAAAAALIVLPRRTGGSVTASAEIERAALLEERRQLYAELRELDDDTTAGRISADDRARGRRVLAPRLRAVTEALRAHGVDGDSLE